MQLCLPPVRSPGKNEGSLYGTNNMSTIARATKPGGIALLFTLVAIGSYPH